MSLLGMRFLQRSIHAVSVMAAAFLAGAVVFFVLSCVGLGVSQPYDAVVEWALIALPWILLALAVWGVWKKVSYRMVLPVIGLCGGFVLYLVWDDEERPLPPEIGPVVPADSKSYEVYRWFLKGDPHSRLAELPVKTVELPHFPKERAEWPEFFSKNRAVFTGAWENDRLGKTWIDAMAQHAPEGIYPPVEKINGPYLSLSPVLPSVRARWGYAQVLMLDQRYDKALRLLTPILRTSYHLQRGGSQWSTAILAEMCLKNTLDQLELLSDVHKLSPEVRAEIVAALKEAPPIEMVFRNIYFGEQMYFRVLIDTTRKAQGLSMKAKSTPMDSNNYCDRFLARLLCNPHRIEREYVEFTRELLRLSMDRQLESGDKLAKAFKERLDRMPVKNPIGHLLLVMSEHSFHGMTHEIWQSEDRRLALLKRLETP